MPSSIPFTNDELMRAFWAKVDRSGECWIWMAARQPNGYGRFGVLGKLVMAHRFAWESVHGPIPIGLFACHKCDVPSCVRPDHIFIGTQADNLRDMDSKGRRVSRALRGTENPFAKLTEDDVIDIRSVYAFGARIAHIAKAYGVHKKTIHDVLAGRTWGHV